MLKDHLYATVKLFLRYGDTGRPPDFVIQATITVNLTPLCFERSHLIRTHSSLEIKKKIRTCRVRASRVEILYGFTVKASIFLRRLIVA